MARLSARTRHKVRTALVINTTGIVIAKTWIAVGYDCRLWPLLLLRSPASLLLTPISIRYGLRIGILVLVCATCLIHALLFFLKRFRFFKHAPESTACGGLIVVFGLAAGPLIHSRRCRNRGSHGRLVDLWGFHAAAHFLLKLRFGSLHSLLLNRILGPFVLNQRSALITIARPVREGQFVSGILTAKNLPMSW